MPDFDKTRTVAITGGGSGIGAAVARRIAGPGVRLVLHTRGVESESRARLEAVARECQREGATCALVVGDMGEIGRGKECVDAAIARFGGIDQIVHAAGVVNKSLPGKLTRPEFDFCMSVMPGALLELATAALPFLAKSSVGRIVAISSFIAHKIDAHSLAPASAAAKAAMEALAKCLARQLASSRTTVNCIVPGYTRKDAGKLGSLSQEGWQQAAMRTPTRRLGEPGEVAAAVEFLLSENARQITGATLTVDGGLTLG
jgi:NAD(P)-dependent dehydrogenase (short-subunit alcohol dehydrogenase family)